MIAAKLVAEGAGLPAVWLCASACEPQRYFTIEAGPPPEGVRLSLSDPQTAFGVALKLDKWEARTPKQSFDEWQNSPHRHYWTAAVGNSSFSPGAGAAVREERLTMLRAAMIARLTHIGMDHGIRRALGWEVKPGTLATLKYDMFDRWWLDYGGEDGECHAIKLPGILTEAEARAATYAELCS